MKRRRTAQCEGASTESITSDEMWIEKLKAENDRLRAENSQLRRTVKEVSKSIVSGKLKGELPSNFLERFRDLPDHPLEKVLQYLPVQQLIQVRYVSRRFNQLIKQCSKSLPKIVISRILFDNISAGQLRVHCSPQYGYEFTKTSNDAALSELLRFIRIEDWIIFGDGAAADWVLDELSKPWLNIRSLYVYFIGDLSQTSVGSLKAFLTVLSPFVELLHFEHVYNIPDGLLSDELFAITHRLAGLLVLPKENFERINIGDSTLLSMADAEKMPTYFCVMGCSGFTPGGVRAFVEKTMDKKRARDWKYNRGCELVFYNCANVTSKEVAEACGYILEKVTEEERRGSLKDIGRNTLQCSLSKHPLRIYFHFSPFRWNVYLNPDVVMDDEDNDIGEFRKALARQFVGNVPGNPLLRYNQLFGESEDDEDDEDDDEDEDESDFW